MMVTGRQEARGTPHGWTHPPGEAGVLWFRRGSLAWRGPHTAVLMPLPAPGGPPARDWSPRPRPGAERPAPWGPDLGRWTLWCGGTVCPGQTVLAVAQYSKADVGTQAPRPKDADGVCSLITVAGATPLGPLVRHPGTQVPKSATLCLAQSASR